MVTGASTADLAVMLVDAAPRAWPSRPGATPRSPPPSASPGWCWPSTRWTWSTGPRSRFDELAEEFACFADPLGFVAITPIPLSALHGDNVVDPSAAAAWYAGPTLLGHLEEVPVGPGPGRRRRSAPAWPCSG